VESQESRQVFAVINILDRVKIIIGVKVSYMISAMHRVFEKSGLKENILLGFGRMGIEVKVLECFGFDILKSLPHRTQLLPVSIGLKTFASVLFSDTTGVSKADLFSVLLLSKCQHDIFLCSPPPI